MTETYNTVNDFYIGNTRIRVSDECCRGKTTADADRILHKIAQNAMNAFSAASAKATVTGNHNKKDDRCDI